MHRTRSRGVAVLMIVAAALRCGGLRAAALAAVLALPASLRCSPVPVGGD